MRGAEHADLARVLSFEAQPNGTLPGGWGGGPLNTIAVDDKVVHGGKRSVRLERREDASQQFSTLTKALPVDFAGTRIELRGFLRTEAVSGYTGLWMREDGEGGSVAFNNMQQRQLHGTTDWTEYSIVLPLRAEARQVFIGVLLSGTGTTWAADLQLSVDGKPIWEAPKMERPKTPIETDHEFDQGSKVSVGAMTAVQVSNLAMLGKVWGFLKYHHPQIVNGQRHWDYEMLRVLPKVLAATDHAAANQVLVDWVKALGPVDACRQCATLEEKDLQLRPDLAWLSDEKLLGAELSKSLLAIHKNRLPNKQFYVSLTGTTNPSFDHELRYASIPLPDAGFQLLALYRFWNIVEYWSPNREIVGENWDGVLAEFIPRLMLAKNAHDYTREMFALVALDHDTHANLWGLQPMLPPEGACEIPVTVRFIENQAVVTGYKADEGKSSGLRVGDVIAKLDGVPVAKLVAEWSPYYAASNDPTRLRDIARSMTRGTCGDARVGVVRGGEESEVVTPRASSGGLDVMAGHTHDLPGDTFRKLSDDVAYLKLSSINAADVPRYIDSAAGTKGLIVDLRNYPSEFVVFALGRLLVDRESHFVEFTHCDLSNPGAFHWMEGPVLMPTTPHYSGKVVVLIDEVTQSQAEYTTMAFRASPRTTVIGSTTAGADGNVSQFSLPGGLSSMISGLGIFYPDRKPTQRVGILADVEVKPTIAGIRAGRDELMEEALRRSSAQRRHRS